MEIKYRDMLVDVDILKGPTKRTYDEPGYNAEFRIISAYRLNKEEIDAVELDLLRHDMFFIQLVNDAYEQSLNDREFERD